jgi:glycogen(starch) synthase
VRILVVSNLYPPDYMGGYELGCRQMVDALRGRGHEVRVLTTVPRAPVPSEPHVRRTLRLTDIFSHYLFTHSAPITSMLAEAESHHINAANVHALLAELEDFRPDVTYVWMTIAVGGLGLLGCLHYLGKPWVWHLMDCVPLVLCHSSIRQQPVYASALEGLLRDGCYIACSRHVVEEIERGGVRLGPNVKLIPNWVEGEPAPPHRAYLPDGRLRIATAAAQIKVGLDKGIELLIEAAALLREAVCVDFEIDIYGQVIDHSYESTIRARGLDSIVRLRGPRTQAQLLDLYGRYDLFAYPTREREPFGFAALEAGARGCVPVMSRICGIAEWLADGVHVIKAERTPEAFARAFADVLAGRIDLAPIGRRLAGVIRRDFHINAVAPRIERVLEQESGRPREPGGNPDDAYRLAVLAERLNRVLVHHALSA